MPNKPDNEAIKNSVYTYLAGYAVLDVNFIEDKWELSGPQLNYNTDKLRYLAMSLRGYILYFTKGVSTLTAKEISKAGLTVKGLVELVISKIQG